MPGARASAGRGGEQALLAAAQDGDEQAFVGLTSPHRRALHIHCYRMLGSLHDADDALQETMLRAWKGLPRFEPRAPLAAWLSRIATNVALRMIEQRRDPAAPAGAHLQPYPERLLDELAAPHPGPEDIAAAREGVGLAFVAAMQLLPPKQRAVLVLRDALDWPARDVARCSRTRCRPSTAHSSARESGSRASSRPARSLACTRLRPRKSRRR